MEILLVEGGRGGVEVLGRVRERLGDLVRGALLTLENFVHGGKGLIFILIILELAS
jgi:hypothetical protein